MQFFVMSRQDVELGAIIDLQDQLNPHSLGFQPSVNVKFGIVSITDTGARYANVLYRPWCTTDVLELKFDDLDLPVMGQYRGITEEQARQAVDFIRKMVRTNTDIVVVHCEAGISRSAGMAAALAKLAGESDDQFFQPPYCPNRYVYSEVLKAGGMLHSWQENPVTDQSIMVEFSHETSTNFIWVTWYESSEQHRRIPVAGVVSDATIRMMVSQDPLVPGDWSTIAVTWSPEAAHHAENESA